MIDNAVALLKPGGVLVFSTCTLNPLENECNVAYALRTHRGLVLEDVPDRVRVGGRGVAGTPWVGVLEGDKAKEGRRSGGEGSGGRRIGKRGGEEGEEAGGMGERGPGGEEGAIAGSEFGGCGREAVREVGGLLGVAGERKGGEEEGEGKNRNRADSGTVGSGDAAGSATSLGRWQFGLSDKEAAMVQRFGPGAGGLGDECPGFFIARLRKTQ